MEAAAPSSTICFSPIVMKILHRYIAGGFLATFVAVLLVMLGVLVLGNLIRIADLIIKGVDAGLLLRFLFFLNVRLLQYAIPMALVLATLLTFGKLAAGNEITAMRAGGIGLSSISSPVIISAAILTAFSIYLNNNAVPQSQFSARRLKDELAMIDPRVLLEPGRFVRFPGHAISVQKRKEDRLENLWIYRYENGRLVSAIMAAQAEIEPDPGDDGFTLILHNGSMEEYDPSGTAPAHTMFRKLRYPIKLSEIFSRDEQAPKRADEMTRAELIRYRRQLRAQPATADKLLSRITTEIHTRLALSFASLSTVLISIPLALKTHRSEKSIALSLGLLLISVFYGFILLSQALEDSPGHYPHLIAWAPNLLFGVAGLTGMAKLIKV